MVRIMFLHFSRARYNLRSPRSGPHCLFPNFFTFHVCFTFNGLRAYGLFTCRVKPDSSLSDAKISNEFPFRILLLSLTVSFELGT